MFDRFAIILGIKANHFIISFWEWATTRLGTMFYPLTIKSILATLILDRSSEDIVLSHCIALWDLSTSTIYKHLCAHILPPNMQWIWKSVAVSRVWTWIWKIVIGCVTTRLFFLVERCKLTQFVLVAARWRVLGTSCFILPEISRCLGTSWQYILATIFCEIGWRIELLQLSNISAGVIILRKYI